MSDYTLGFITGQVQIAMQQARVRDELHRFRKKPWPETDDIQALIKELAPQSLDLQPLSFARAFADVWRRWPTDPSGSDTPVVRGALNGSRIICVVYGDTGALKQDQPTKEIEGLVKDYSRLPERHPVWGRIFWSQARAYRYLVLRTLGANVFGLTVEDAGRIAMMR